MNGNITELERKVASKSGLSESEYLAKRQAFCTKAQVTWSLASALSQEDINVINKTGMDANAFRNAKIETLASQICNQ